MLGGQVGNLIPIKEGQRLQTQPSEHDQSNYENSKKKSKKLSHAQTTEINTQAITFGKAMGNNPKMGATFKA